MTRHALSVLRQGVADSGVQSNIAKLWYKALWACAPVAIAANLLFLSIGMDGRRESEGSAIWTSYSERHRRQVYFIQRLWYFMWSRDLSWKDLGHASIKGTLLELVSRRIGLRRRCDDQGLALSWDQGDGVRIERVNTGAGDCLLAMEDLGGSPVGTVIVEASHDAFLCPSAAPPGLWPTAAAEGPPPPLAIRLIPKSASTSVMMWASELEGLRQYYDRIAKSTEWQFLGLQANFRRSLRSLGCSKRMRRVWRDRFAHFAPRFTGLPPELCPSRCSGLGRQKVAFVRNPFKRVVSFFSNGVEGRERDLPHNTHSFGEGMFYWENFSRFVAGLGEWMARVAWERCSGTASPRDLDMWWHLQPQVVLIEGLPECPGATAENQRRKVGGDVQEYFLLHLETLDRDLAQLERRLCRLGGLESDMLGRCRKLPRLGARNVGSTRAPQPPSRDLWNADLVAHMEQLYGADFDVLGYARDPDDTKPVLKAEVA